MSDLSDLDADLLQSERELGLEAQIGRPHPGLFDDPTDSLTDHLAEEIESTPVKATEVLRRGLRANPELRRGLAFTLVMAVVVAIGRLTTPVLIQQILDKGVDGADGFQPRFVITASLVALVVTVTVVVTARATYIRLVESAELMLRNLRVAGFAHIHALEHRRPQRVAARGAHGPGHQRRRDHRPVRPVGRHRLGGQLGHHPGHARGDGRVLVAADAGHDRDDGPAAAVDAQRSSAVSSRPTTSCGSGWARPCRWCRRR